MAVVFICCRADRPISPTVWETRLADGSVVADGRIAVAALAERTGWDLPVDSDYETLGGLVTTFLGRIPAKGEVVDTGPFRFEVLEADPRRVLQVRAARREPQPDDGPDTVSGNAPPKLGRGIRTSNTARPTLSPLQ